MIDPVAIGTWGTEFDQHVPRFAEIYGSALRNLPDWAHVALVREFIRGSSRGSIASEVLEPYVQLWSGAIGQEAFYEQIAQYDMRYTDEIRERLAEVRCPTQLLWGEADAWLPMDQFATRLTKLLPLLRFRSIAGSGHLVPEDAPQAIVTAVFDFLCEDRFTALVQAQSSPLLSIKTDS